VAVTIAAACAAGATLAGCGGGEKQDVNEPSGNFSVKIIAATFPQQQRLAKQETLSIQVKNLETQRALPNVALTIGDEDGNGFDYRSEQAGLADPNRPTWIVDTAPAGGVTAYVNTWALGSLGPGELKTFSWKVTPIKPGVHTVNYRVAAGLNGKAKAIQPDGGVPEGSFTVRVSGKPAQASVDPKTGKVIRKG
jgi:hypothetical protein